MRKLTWSDRALDGMDSVIGYVAADSPRAADLILDRVEMTANLLAQMPAGRPGRVGGAYEKLASRTPYIIVYALTDDTVRILHIVHGSQDWPEGEQPAE